jgi:hypothetical protein
VSKIIGIFRIGGRQAKKKIARAVDPGSGGSLHLQKAGKLGLPKQRRKTMRVMVLVKATPESEANAMPTADMTAMFEKMGKYNDELIKAGIMISGEGLLPSSAGKRVHISGSKRTVIDGPFAETKELVAGFWIWQVKSMEEAVEWARRCPETMPDEESDLEIRVIGEMADFGPAATPEVIEMEKRQREELEKQSAR